MNVFTAKQNIILGREYENEVVTIQFPVAKWRREYGNGYFTLSHRRPKDDAPHQCVIAEDADYVYWVVKDSEMARRGYGEAQLTYHVGEKKAKSEIFTTYIADSLPEDVDPPEAERAWQEELEKRINQCRFNGRNISKIADYLYYIEYSTWDYEIGKKHYKHNASSLARCSSVRKGNVFGRNYDWNYDKTAEFIVKTKAVQGRHASIGIANGASVLTEEFMSEGRWHDDLDFVIFHTTDGINDAGVACSINLAPSGDKGKTTGTNPGKERMSVVMLVRYILDYADSAAHAIELIQTKLDLWSPHTEGLDEECHFMLADSENTYIVEFVDNEVKVMSDADDDYPAIPNDKAIMTNFYLDGWNGETVTGFEVGGIGPTETTLTAHAAGVERYDILSSGYNGVTDAQSMATLMKSVKYTNAYNSDVSPFWYSEFVGDFGSIGDFTIYLDKSVYEPFVAEAIELYENRKRDGTTWQTVHTSVYDIANRKLTVFSQESDDGYQFDLKDALDVTTWKSGDGEYSVQTFGTSCKAIGDYSVAEGLESVANNIAEHAEGRWNYSHSENPSEWGNDGNTLHSVGFGTSSSNKKNAFEIMQNGAIYVYGLGGYDGTNPSESTSLQELISSLLYN